MKYLSLLPSSPFTDAIRSEHEAKQRWINQQKKGFLRFRTPFEGLARFRARHLDCTQEKVIIGLPEEVEKSNHQLIRKELQAFMPWRKGPFSVFGVDIDAEWRSEKKWQRLVPELPDLKDKVIADIGCNNGYYMFRMLPYEPRLVLGLEPSVQHYYCFKALSKMAGTKNLHVDLLGVEHINLFPNSFDVIFLLGIIYHRISPVEVLRDIHTALKPGGTLLLESQAIPGNDPWALFPEKTYAKVPGTYFVPTASCLHNWLLRAGFREARLFSSHPMSSKEQRKTEWMTFESYSDFIDPNDPSLTIEGYPAPIRVFFTVSK